MNTNHFISGIHNYCDRWCERCAFIDRCTIGHMEQQRWAKGSDWNPEDFFEELEKMYPSSEETMHQWLLENDIDFSHIEPEELPKPKLKSKALAAEMRMRQEAYDEPFKIFLDANDEALETHGIDLNGDQERLNGRDTQERSALAEAIDVLLWYQFFMFVKAGRAISGLEDMRDTIWGTHQSDANGSAKVALIGAERSLGAWEILRRQWPEKQAEILGFMRHINGFRQRMEQLFPNWRKFIRPGFDTEKPHSLPFGDN